MTWAAFGGFRWVKPAASLKPEESRLTAEVQTVFPLGKTGGLIEARRPHTGRHHARLWFPLGKTGGLIEARSNGYDRSHARPVFPLGKTGGLIEARYAGQR